MCAKAGCQGALAHKNAVSYLLETLGKEMGEENVEWAAFQNPDVSNTCAAPGASMGGQYYVN